MFASPFGRDGSHAPSDDRPRSVASDLVRRLPTELAEAFSTVHQSSDPVATLQNVNQVFAKFAKDLDALAAATRPPTQAAPQVAERIQRLEREIGALKGELGLAEDAPHANGTNGTHPAACSVDDISGRLEELFSHLIASRQGALPQER